MSALDTKVPASLKHINTTRFYQNSPCVRDPRKTVIDGSDTDDDDAGDARDASDASLVMQSTINNASDNDDDDDRVLFPVLLSVVISPYSSTLSCSTITSDSNKLVGIYISTYTSILYCTTPLVILPN
jgi:hypothetical protein